MVAAVSSLILRESADKSGWCGGDPENLMRYLILGEIGDKCGWCGGNCKNLCFASIIVVLDHSLQPSHVTLWYVWLQWGNFGHSMCKVTNLASGVLLIDVCGCVSAVNKLCFPD